MPLNFGQKESSFEKRFKLWLLFIVLNKLNMASAYFAYFAYRV